MSGLLQSTHGKISRETLLSLTFRTSFILVIVSVLWIILCSSPTPQDPQRRIASEFAYFGMGELTRAAALGEGTCGRNLIHLQEFYKIHSHLCQKIEHQKTDGVKPKDVAFMPEGTKFHKQGGLRTWRDLFANSTGYSSEVVHALLTDNDHGLARHTGVSAACRESLEECRNKIEACKTNIIDVIMFSKNVTGYVNRVTAGVCSLKLACMVTQKEWCTGYLDVFKIPRDMHSDIIQTQESYTGEDCMKILEGEEFLTDIGTIQRFREKFPEFFTENTDRNVDYRVSP